MVEFAILLRQRLLPWFVFMETRFRVRKTERDTMYTTNTQHIFSVTREMFFCLGHPSRWARREDTFRAYGSVLDSQSRVRCFLPDTWGLFVL